MFLCAKTIGTQLNTSACITGTLNHSHYIIFWWLFVGLNGTNRARFRNLKESSEVPVSLRHRKAVISKQTKNEEVEKRVGIFAAMNYQLSPLHAVARVAAWNILPPPSRAGRLLLTSRCSPAGGFCRKAPQLPRQGAP